MTTYTGGDTGDTGDSGGDDDTAKRERPMMLPDEVTWRPERLTCERRGQGALIGTARPRLAWRHPAELGDDVGAAAQVRVVASEAGERAREVWDSGWFEIDLPRVRYDGPPLASRQRLAWSVRVRTRAGRTSAWSNAAPFEVGLLERSDWSASWISRPPAVATSRAAYFLRRQFLVEGTVSAARVYATALGVYRLALNGQPIGDGLLRPGWTDSRRRVQYDAIDLGPCLRDGTNVLAAEVAPGWYAGRIASHAPPESSQAVPVLELLAQIELTLDDGTRITLASDESWEWAPSPILASDLYDGEDWDLRLADPHWAEAGSALDWAPVERSNGTAGMVVAPRCGPVRVIDRGPVAVSFRPDGTALVDSGRNDTGYLAVTVAERAGRRVTVAYGEVLDPAGNLYRENLRSARCVDTFLCKGGTEERLAPSYSYRGYRYAEVSGLSAPSSLVAAEFVSLGSELERTGWFSSAATVLEEIYEMMVCSLRANYLEAPTDCPQRDERMGWLADALLFAPVAAYTVDISAFMAKWLDDVLDARTPSGSFPDIAPRPSARWPGRSFDPGAPAWADAGVQLPWLLYERYGDDDVLQEMLPAIVTHLDVVHAENPDGIWRNGRGKDYGDWVPAGPDTSHDLFSTCWLYRSTEIAAKVAAVCGDRASADRLARRAKDVRRAFAARYVDASTGRVADPEAQGSLTASRHAPSVAAETQTGYALALAFGLVDGPVATMAGARLAGLVRAASGHLSTGFCGSAFLPAVLERSGHADLAYDLLLGTEPPSLGFMARMGATSVWERWDGLDPAGWPACPSMNSFNHYAMSSMLSWLVEGVCGLRPTPDVPALREIRFEPAVSRKVPSVDFRFEAPSGTVELGWAWSGSDRVLGHLRLPPGMRATIAGAIAIDADQNAAFESRSETVGGIERQVGPGDHEIVWRAISPSPGVVPPR